MSYLAPLLGWVLLQAAWQCLAAALLLIVSLRWMRGSPAARRYRCAVLHLAGALAAVVLAGAVSHASVASALPVAIWNARAASFTGASDGSQWWLQAAGLVWLAGIVILHASLTVRWLRLRRFLARATPASPAVTSLVKELSAAAGLPSPPQVRSADVQSPMVAGCRPAYLLLPRAFAETWPPAEQRALVAHELAHIRRGDYGRNLWHLSAVSLLWWHPAAWLIYARIRHERECASDELAVGLAGSAALLAKALLRMVDSSAAHLLTAAAGSGGLPDRLERLARLPRTRGCRSSTAFLAIAAAALMALTVILNSSAARREALTWAYAASAVAPPRLFTFQAHDPAGTFQVKMVRGRVLAIDLGSDSVPPKRIVQKGATVQVLAEGGGELLRIEVDPRGAIHWKARQRS